MDGVDGEGKRRDNGHRGRGWEVIGRVKYRRVSSGAGKERIRVAEPIEQRGRQRVVEGNTVRGTGPVRPGVGPHGKVTWGRKVRLREVR